MMKEIVRAIKKDRNRIVGKYYREGVTMSWLNELMISTIELESPRSFWYWSGLAAISAIAKDNVFLNRAGAYKLYPNIYVMLLARSGLRKGPPINLAKDLVKRVNNTRIISGRSSIQGILKELGTAQSAPGGGVNSKSYGFIVASEFTSSLVEDRAAMTILTDLYDRNYNEGEYRSLLKMESFNLKDPTITMLVGTNEPHFEDFITSKDVHGGFIGRMFIISESKKHKSNSLIDDLENPPVPEQLVIYLKEVAKLKGQFETLSKTEAGEFYNDWYMNLDKYIEEGKIEDKTGTIERIGDSVLKVAMLLSLSKECKLVIDTESMKEAITVCEKLIGNVRKSTMKQGKSQWTNEKGLIIQELMDRDNHMISRQQLNSKYWMNANSSEWDEIMVSLEAAGIVSIEQHGPTVVYVMPDKIVDEWKKHLRGKLR